MADPVASFNRMHVNEFIWLEREREDQLPFELESKQTPIHQQQEHHEEAIVNNVKNKIQG